MEVVDLRRMVPAHRRGTPAPRASCERARSRFPPARSPDRRIRPALRTRMPKCVRSGLDGYWCTPRKDVCCESSVVICRHRAVRCIQRPLCRRHRLDYAFRCLSALLPIRNSQDGNTAYGIAGEASGQPPVPQIDERVSDGGEVGHQEQRPCGARYSGCTICVCGRLVDLRHIGEDADAVASSKERKCNLFEVHGVAPTMLSFEICSDARGA